MDSQKDSEKKGGIDRIDAEGSPRIRESGLPHQADLQDLQSQFSNYVKESEREIRSLIGAQRYLQKVIYGIIAAVIVMGLGTSVFFIKQMRLVRQQLELQRGASQNSLRDFKVRIEPEIQRFAGELQSFSATNTSFRPTLEVFQDRLSKYFSTLPSGSTEKPSKPLNESAPTP